MKIGLIQMSSVLNPESNLSFIENELSQNLDKELKYIFLPECFYSFSDGLKPSPYQVDFQNEHFEAISNIAKKYSVYLLGGSVAFHVGNGKNPLNRVLNFSDEGKLINYYDKLNLFKINLDDVTPDKKVIDESLMFSQGKRNDENFKVIDINNQMKLASAVCFDLRFPELFRKYFSMGANVISLSAAFTKKTGKVHWHNLLKSRAIENQCYVIAPAQCGIHNERISTYGHSLVVDPWGEVIYDASTKLGLHSVEINMDKVLEVRSRMDMSYFPEHYS